WSSDVCSSDLHLLGSALIGAAGTREELLDLLPVVATAPPHGREQVLHRLLLLLPIRAGRGLTPALLLALLLGGELAAGAVDIAAAGVPHRGGHTCRS